jgi:hypothetical protein
MHWSQLLKYKVKDMNILDLLKSLIKQQPALFLQLTLATGRELPMVE